MKILHEKYKTGEERLWMFCPGCNEPHSVALNGQCKWDWNGSIESPTISPSILVTQPPTDYRCHSFVREGRWQFLDDCNHALKGTTVEIPEYPDKYR